MTRPWFDAETGALLFDEYVQAMPSFRKVMEDEIVTEDELKHHAEQVVGLLRQMDERLPADLKELATEALCELAVLYALQRRYAEQDLRF